MLQQLKQNIIRETFIQIVSIQFGKDTSYRVAKFENKNDNLKFVSEQTFNS